ncbi:4-hydroxythreonine-4-phosphate dehydrogenase PdxA [Akkermansiaceae bacterium]|nr:4-hydroxythreonine-4-phosphate dehydrogenase PdxA [Akkermansiaceae bacterium]
MKSLIVTQGDPAGVGPELCLRVLNSELAKEFPMQVMGCRNLLGKIAAKLGWDFDPASVVDVPCSEEVEPGVVSAVAGRHGFACLEAAVEATMRGEFSGMVTNPINKEGWDLAGHHYPGHTEYLVEKTGAESHAMMLTSGEITCSLVTTHVGLAEVPKILSEERILEVTRLTNEAMSVIRNRPVRLAMPGLNPHAGEGGLFGREEIELLVPCLEKLRGEGIEIMGPLSPDTAFLPELRKEVDAYICIYHDQGLIPLKTLAFDLGVNVTLGLPIVRTSVDHGTAFDLAWTGQASPTSLYEAVKLAGALSK